MHPPLPIILGIIVLALFSNTHQVFSQKNLYILNRGNHSLVSLPTDSPGSAFTIETEQGLYSAFDLVANESTGELFWADGFNHKIIQSNVADPLSQVISPFAVSMPVDLRLDLANESMYWVDNTEKRVIRSKIDGSLVETMPTTILSDPSALEIIPDQKLLFYADIGTHSIWRIDMFGTNPVELVKSDAGYPVRLLIDPGAGKLYWANDGEHLIERINIDGTDREVFYTGTQDEYPFGLFLDQQNKQLYWTDYGLDRVMKAPTNGQAMPELVVEGLADPVAIVIMDAPAFKKASSASRANNEEVMPRLALFPNPANQMVIFSSLNESQAIEWLKLFDPTGKEIYFQHINSNTYSLDIQTLPEGYYRYSSLVAGFMLSGHFSIIH